MTVKQNIIQEFSQQIQLQTFFDRTGNFSANSRS